MTDLFERARQKRLERESPLANRMRPRTLDEFVGQEHIVGPGRLLRRAIGADQLSSLIFYGPPGTGKTTLARVIANTTESHFITINAVLAGVKEIREAIETARRRRAEQDQRTILFVDEVHRWNKAQQDALLPHVENGTIVLVGATTENPYFEVNKALVSRSRIFQLKPLGPGELEQVARRALSDPERGYGNLNVEMDPEALAHLVNVANGDARSVLNALELAVETTPPEADGVIRVNLAVAEESIQRRAVLYDKEGDVHYDTISAFIKSLRGSDPDAALYWMAKMVYAGEDPRFIFRRMAILASEDVGLADPRAAQVVASCWELFERIGMPEGRFPLAEAALYLATCPKSNSAFAFFDALRAVQAEAEAEVPNHLKDASRDKEGFGHGEGYLYPHAYRDHWVAQQYLPDALQGRLFYQPSDQGYERTLAAQVARRREEQLAAMVEAPLGLPEVLVTGPKDRARDAWLKRTLAASGRTLGRIRECVFAKAAVASHHLVLDLHAGSGLLTWEALRQASQGGVWAHTMDPTAAQALAEQSGRLPELDRPAVLLGAAQDLSDLGALLAERGDGQVRFDRIVGRGALRPPSRLRGEARGQYLAALAARLLERLLPGGRLVLAQTIPRQSQRLHALLDWSGAPEGLAEKVRLAEERAYGLRESEGRPERAGLQPPEVLAPSVEWDAHDLEEALQAAGFESVSATVETLREERRIHPRLVDRWFPPAGEPIPEDSYVAMLGRAGITPPELEAVAERFRSQLAGRVVSWRIGVAILRGERPAEPPERAGGPAQPSRQDINRKAGAS